jgi:hypothetical protein
MAHTRVRDLDEHFPFTRRFDIDLDDLEGFAGPERNGST